MGVLMCNKNFFPDCVSRIQDSDQSVEIISTVSRIAESAEVLPEVSLSGSLVEYIEIRMKRIPVKWIESYGFKAHKPSVCIEYRTGTIRFCLRSKGNFIVIGDVVCK